MKKNGSHLRQHKYILILTVCMCVCVYVYVTDSSTRTKIITSITVMLIIHNFIIV